MTSDVVLPAVLPSRGVAQREKRSISMPPELAEKIESAAAAEGKTFSAWIADTLHRHFKLEAGRRGIEEYEREYGAFTPKEIAEGVARARRSLGLDKSARRPKKAS